MSACLLFYKKWRGKTIKKDYCRPAYKLHLHNQKSPDGIKFINASYNLKKVYQDRRCII